MAGQRIQQIGGINSYVNPISRDNGELIKAVNVTSDFYGTKKKRSGYSTFLGTADGSVVDNLFSYYQNDGTTFFLYRVSGGKLYYSSQGTGAWTVAANGTFTAGNILGHGILDNTLIVGEAAGSMYYTTDGTAFTNAALAPVGAASIEQYQNRIYAIGTASDLFYSTTNDATNWNTSGTSDSSSLKIPGAGKLQNIFKCNDRIVAIKEGGEMFRWDGYSLVEMASKLGPSSQKSIAEVEGYYFWLNRLGIFGYGGDRPELLSNPVQRLIYNSSGSAIAGTVFETAPAAIYKYDYFVGVGTVTDNYVSETITNCLIKYDFNKNEFLTWSLAEDPTAMLSYKDADGVDQFVFAGSGGQCYQFSDSTYADNGSPIQAEMLFQVDAGIIELDKIWNWLFLYFNPGCQAQVQVACTDSLSPINLSWIDIGDVSEGIIRYKLPSGSRSKLLYIKITESSTAKPFVFYGFSYDATPITL